MKMAAWVATVASDDPNTQNAAVLAKFDSMVVVASNRIPTGLANRIDRLERPAKYSWVEHAERAVIYKAAMGGWSIRGATMYCLWFACPDCARAIIQAGVKEVVGHVATRNATPSRWLHDVKLGEQMLREAKVGMRWLADDLGATIRFDGKELRL